MPWAVLIPAAFAILRFVTKRYVFSALTTLSCAALAMPRDPLIGAALILSAAGDWFMAHRNSDERRFILGIGFFAAAHLVFLAGAAARVRTVAGPLIAMAVLAVFYGLYLTRYILPKVDGGLRLPVAVYACVSLAGFTLSLMTADALYAAGIGLLLFSDTMIAQGEFARVRGASLLVLPTYYLHQILVVLSAWL